MFGMLLVKVIYYFRGKKGKSVIQCTACETKFLFMRLLMLEILKQYQVKFPYWGVLIMQTVYAQKSHLLFI